MQREQAHRLVDWLFDLGEQLARRCAPAEARTHFRAARREALLGIRAVVEAALAHVDEGYGQGGEGSEGARREGPRSIPITQA
jgi:hypothetical protein